MSEDKNRHNSIIIDDRKEITVKGITEVISFDEESIVLNTDLGMAVINGSSLHVDRLSLDDGILTASGNIDSFSYQDEPITSGSILRRLFK